MSPPGQPVPVDAPRRGVVGVIARHSRLLVIRRSLTVRAPGAYCFPGGEIEAGESEFDALCRELREEVGLSATPVRRLWQSHTPSGVALAWWLADAAEQSPVPNPAEVAECLWLEPDAIRALPLLLPSNHGFLDAWQRSEFSWD